MSNTNEQIEKKKRKIEQEAILKSVIGNNVQITSFDNFPFLSNLFVRNPIIPMLF